MSNRTRYKKAEAKEYVQIGLAIIVSLVTGIILFWLAAPPVLGILATGLLVIISYLGGGAIDLVVKNKNYVKYGLLSGAVICVGLIAYEQLMPTREQLLQNFSEGLIQGLTEKPNSIKPQKIDIKWSHNFIILEIMTSGMDLEKPIINTQISSVSPEQLMDFQPFLEVLMGRDSRATVVSDWAFIYGDTPDPEWKWILDGKMPWAADKYVDMQNTKDLFTNALVESKAFIYRNCSFIRTQNGTVLTYDNKDWLVILYVEPSNIGFKYGLDIAKELLTIDENITAMKPYHTKDMDTFLIDGQTYNWKIILGSAEKQNQ